MTDQPADNPIHALSHADRLAEDRQARRDALDVGRSFLVQAPAGSGKTELLTKRVLALLSVVDEPEDILAITFTVAATAEMRNRVMAALAAAKPFLHTQERPEEHTHALAALERSRERGWFLLEQPRRLNIQTIDALCLSIAHSAPLLSRLGGKLQPTEDADPLYALAARRTLEQLGGAIPQLSEALKNLLRLRDVNLGNCEQLIADMLQARDQWLEEVSIAQSLSEEDWLTLRKNLEAPFLREHRSVLQLVRSTLRNHANDIQRLLVLLKDACDETPLPAEIAAIHGMISLDELLHLEHFKCLRSILLTDASSWRKRAGDAPGFKPQNRGGRKEHHDEFKSILDNISQSDGLLDALIQLASLPGLAYTESEWETIRSIFTVLLHAVGELRVVFNERGKMDFVEAGLTAGWALSNDEVRHDVSHRTRHLLVDEFQDTSRKQYDLLKSIVREWAPEEHRTCFFVGDPMQSIYLFRHAELALFDEVQQHGFGQDAPGIHFQRLTLSQNFRSTEAVVEPINAMFEKAIEAGKAGASRFTPAVAHSSITSVNAFLFHPRFLDEENASADSRVTDKAAPIVETIRRYVPHLDHARARGESFRIGVLVRAKQHVSSIAAALRSENISFRAIDIETLKDRQEVRDLVSLVRALTQPMDRVAWLAIVRAPWCGVALADLHILAGQDDRTQLGRPMRELLAERSHLISSDGQRRVQHLRKVIERSLSLRHSGDFLAAPNGFATWIEQTWIALGGEHCIDKTGRENVDAFFRLLATLSPLEAIGASLNARLEKLFAAPDPTAQEQCSIQLMTIHKAKGLGFDVVLLPELHRESGRSRHPLLRRMARLQRNSTDRELLLAPIGAKGQDTSATYTWIGRQVEKEELDEIQRLFYVACTRARTALHLFADIKPEPKSGYLAAPEEESLLACGWDYLHPEAEQHFALWRQSQPVVTARGDASMPQAASSSMPPALLKVAASAEQHTRTRKRLPSSWVSAQSVEVTAPEEEPHALHPHRERVRHPSMASRARGVTLHSLLEQLAVLPGQDDRWNVQRNDAYWRKIATALLRNAGLLRREVETETESVLAILAAAAGDPNARWMLSKKPYELNEASWTIQEEGRLRTIRCDRVFVAGAEPLTSGHGHLWIVDYKTADVDADSFLLEEQSRYAPQLMRYAEALSKSADFAGRHLPVILALYYPALPRLQWWPA